MSVHAAYQCPGRKCAECGRVVEIVLPGSLCADCFEPRVPT